MLKKFFDVALGKGHGLTNREMLVGVLQAGLLLVALFGFFALAYIFAATH